MNVITRGIRNAFRNVIRTVSLVVILGLSMGLMLAMLVAYQAVGKKIESVKSSIGNTVSISPAGARGFEGGGTALTETALAKVKSVDHVTSISETLSDRLTTENTDLESAIEAGDLGQRNAGNSGQSSTDTQVVPPSGEASGVGTGGSTTDGSSSTTQTMRNFTPPVTVIGNDDPATALTSSQGGGTFTLKSGKVYAAGSTENVALIGASLATKNSLKVGSTFTAYGKTVTVVGIFDADNTFSNNQVFMPLKTAQTLSDQAGKVTAATVYVDSITNVDSVTTSIKSTLGDTADVTTAAAQAETTITPLENIRTISLYSLIGAVAAGAVIILLTMIMIVRERRREIGVLKAIGASNRVIMGQFVTEAVTLTVLGSIIGIILGVVAGNPITKLLVNNASSSASTATQAAGRMGGGPGRAFGNGFGAARESLAGITANVGWEIILYGLAAAIGIALIGSALASFFIARIRPAEVMRTE